MAKPIFTQSENMSKEYCATVVRIDGVQHIEGTDHLATTLVNGITVVVDDSEVKDGHIMIYAQNETELNEQFLSVNNQFDSSEWEKNANHEEVAKLIAEGKKDEAKERRMFGFFNKYGRVKMIKLKGVYSKGVLFTIDSLLKWKPELKDVDFNALVDQDFDTIGGDLFIKAFVPRIKERPERLSRDQKRNKRLKKFDRMIPGQFSYHYDTTQLSREIGRISPEDDVTITVKVHGCVERSTIVETMEYGPKTIGEIVDGRIDCHIKARDLNRDQDVFVPIDNFYKVENDGEWYEIELEDGRKLTITGNNPVWLPNEGVYRRVDELDGNETVLVS